MRNTQKIRLFAGVLASLAVAYASTATAQAPPAASAFSFGLGELIGMAGVAVTLILGMFGFMLNIKKGNEDVQREIAGVHKTIADVHKTIACVHQAMGEFGERIAKIEVNVEWLKTSSERKDHKQKETDASDF